MSGGERGVRALQVGELLRAMLASCPGEAGRRWASLEDGDVQAGCPSWGG